MPIRGLTDRGASFPQIGTLRKGAPKPEKGPGRDLKYFRFDSDDSDATDRFRTVYGDEPTSVRVFLPFRTAVENFEAWQEHWTAGALQHRCDGETCVLWLTPRHTYSQEAKPCPHMNVARDERDRCKPTGRLKVIIPELRRLAYVTVLTSSIHDIMELSAQIEALEAFRSDLRGIPLILRRQPREISTPSGADGKRRRMEKWLLSIEAAPTWVDLQLQAQEQAALPAPMKLLPAPPANPLTGEVWGSDDDEGDEPQQAAPEPEPIVIAPSKRDRMLHKIAKLTQEAEALDLEIALAKPLAELSDDELAEHGSNLKQAIEQAKQPAEAAA
jgi:hypothetical protein